ncbi:uncharacterized protein [Triticum aestivum]|uniref:uncharacterized protein isoform X1 n=1 Tax=Triticum aestivum TaxID=4565 RepID=UPI001D00E2E8|nr:uncharacterized protein LOC123184373 isoform X1 [Triticum aestivum]
MELSNALHKLLLMFSHVVMRCRGRGRFLFYYFQFTKYLFRYKPDKLLASDGFADQLPEIAEATRGKETVVFQCAFSQDTVILILDALYRGRDYARFFVLETIARVLYFGTAPNISHKQALLEVSSTLASWRNVTSRAMK